MNTLIPLRTGWILAMTGCLIAITPYRAHAAPTIPTGVPEPGLIIWGSVVNSTNVAQPIGLTSASWSVTDGSSNAVFSQLTRPPVRFFTQGDQSYYVLEVPFDTRRFGSVQLQNPIVEGVSSFELMAASPPAYLLTPTINGVLATVRFIDGAPAVGPNVSVAGFNATVRGRVIRVDLSITPTTETYQQWATRIFGNSADPTAGPNADPDQDGLNNAGEYATGTNPLDPSSALRLLQIAVTANQTTVGWQSVPSKQYVLESAPSANGPWTDAVTVSAAGGATQANVAHSPTSKATFYRVRLVNP
jgi:hypothetical protein